MRFGVYIAASRSLFSPSLVERRTAYSTTSITLGAPVRICFCIKVLFLRHVVAKHPPTMKLWDNS
eukprot:scaffold279743_cov32-Tisochrysis_lutea.AAC.2